MAVARKTAPAEDRAHIILAALHAEKETAVKCSLLRVLGGIGDAKALAALEAALQATPEAERDVAVHVLADWPSPAAISVLRGVFRNDQNETYRTLALRGFVRLVSQEEGATGDTLPMLKEALSYVRRSEEKKLVLSGLATVSDPQALALVEPYLGDAAVKDEAALAAVKIANAIAGTQRDLARAAIQKALAASDNAGVREQANRVLQEIEKHEDFVTVWQVAGPYLEAGKTGGQLFDVSFAPETANDASVRWRVETIKAGPNQPAILDLLSLLGGDNRVAYLRTWVHSDEAKQVRLEIGTDDGVKVWLNGALVHANNVDRGVIVGEDRVVVALKKGWNRLLLKITQDGGGWAACVRFRKADGSRLESVRFDSTHDETGTSAN
ncbi:MAG: HEAT repeat domain-containing protein [Limisphaerales bacterium]